VRLHPARQRRRRVVSRRTLTPAIPKALKSTNAVFATMAKRAFTIDTGKEKIEVEGHAHKNVAVKYLMKRRRSLLSTKDPAKVERMYEELPTQVTIIGKQLTKAYKVAWEKKGTGEFVGARFTFQMTDA